MLMLLASSTFWAGSPEARIAATTTVLIAVAALYIVVVGYVPLVGYATLNDKYVLVVSKCIQLPPVTCSCCLLIDSPPDN